MLQQKDKALKISLNHSRNYTKPYKIYAKMPKDAEEQLKKTPDI